jgi:hypothetical protein
MTTQTATATRDAASLVRVLADALGLGLPAPDYITVHPSYVDSATVSAIDFQFNARHGREPLPALYAWADRLGVSVDVNPDSKNPSNIWHEFEFTHSGVLFKAYACVEALDA